MFLIEAGGDHGDSIIQQVPSLYVSDCQPIIHRPVRPADWVSNRSGVGAENPEMAWHFWVRHYRNETQAKRDSKFTYLLDDGSWYTGLDPPEGAEPYASIPACWGEALADIYLGLEHITPEVPR